MNNIGLDSIFNLGKSIVERIWPDPLKRAEELRKLEGLRQKGNLAELDAQVKILLAQLEINKEQSKHKSVFVAGARPSVIWVGSFALAYQGIIHPLLTWIWALLQIKGVLPQEAVPPPYIDSGALTGIVSGLLGVGAMRSYDKSKGTQTDKIRS